MWRCETLFECNWRQFVCLFDLLARKLIWNWNIIVTFWENEEQKISVKVRLHCKLCILLNFSVGSLPLCHSLPTSLPCNHKFDVKQTGQKGLKLNSNGNVIFYQTISFYNCFCSRFHTSKNTFETMGYKSDGNLRNGGQMNGKLEHKSKLSPHIEHITVNIICYIQTISLAAPPPSKFGGWSRTEDNQGGPPQSGVSTSCCHKSQCCIIILEHEYVHLVTQI